MPIPAFLELVEIYATVATIFPYMLGLFFSQAVYGHINGPASLVFFIAAMLFHMAVNVNDNYQDYRKASSEAEYFKTHTNVIGTRHLSLTLVRNIDYGLATVAGLLGILLVFMTGWPLLVMGIVCFVIGYFYAAGPHPISRTPFGEPFSGLTMGYMIMLIEVYLNIAGLVPLDVAFFFKVLLASGIAVFAISNIMLANNISDEAEDLTLNRKTMVYYIGKKAALQVFIWSYVAGYVCLTAAVFMGLFPMLSLLVLLTIPWVWRNTRRFMDKQVKSETFIMSIMNSNILAGASIIAIGLGTLFNI